MMLGKWPLPSRQRPLQNAKVQKRSKCPLGVVQQCSSLLFSVRYLVHAILRDPILSRESWHADTLGVPSTDLRIAAVLLAGSWRLASRGGRFSWIQPLHWRGDSLFQAENKAVICSNGRWQPIPHRGLYVISFQDFEMTMSYATIHLLFLIKQPPSH